MASVTLKEFFEQFGSLFSGNGTITPDEYTQFWDRLVVSKASVSHFVAISIAQYMYLVSGLYRSNPFPDFLLKTTSPSSLQTGDMKVAEDRDTEPLIDSIYSTILYVSLFYDVEITQQLKCAISNWNSFVEKTKTSSFVVNYLTQLVNCNDETQKYIWLVEHLYKIRSNTSMSLIKNREYVAAACVHSYLRTVLQKDPHIAQIIFESITMFLGHPETTKEFILPLLHAFNRFLIVRPGDNRVLTGGYMLIQRKYFLWPKPYSDLAKDILQLLTVEKKAPGHGLREQIYSEIPQLISDKESNTARKIFFFVDTNCENAKEFGDLLSQSIEPINIMEMKLSILANILDEQESDSELLGLEFLTPKDVESYFIEATQILREAVLMKEEDASRFIDRQLGDLKDRIINTCTSSCNETKLYTLPRLPPLELLIEELDCSTEQPKLVDVLDSGILVPERTIEKYFIKLLKDYPGNEVIKIGICGNDKTLHHVVGAITHLNRVASSENLDAFHFYFIPIGSSVFGDWLGRQDPWYGRHVTCLSNAYCSTYPTILPSPVITYCEKQSRKQTVVQRPKQDLSLHSQSLGDADVRRRSSSISTDKALDELKRTFMLADIGTSRNVLCSNLKITKGRKKVSNVANPIAPRSILRSEVEAYFREAKNIVPVQIYQCECWFSDSLQSDLIIPFSLFALIGSEVELQEEIGDDSGKLTTKLRSIAPVLEVQYTLVGFAGSREQKILLPSKTYNQLHLYNISTIDNELSKDALPCVRSLTLGTIEIEKKKRVVNDIVHVSSIEIKSSKLKTHINLDGQRYGPFAKFKIIHASSRISRDTLSIPIMNFLPLRDDMEQDKFHEITNN